MFDPLKPYNDLPNLPPDAPLETQAVLRKVVTSGRALAELKGLGKSIPNQAMLVDSLVLQEAKASSEIENIITTNDALFKAFTAKNKAVDSATKEVLQYQQALWEGYRCLQQRPLLSTNLFIHLVQKIKQNEAGIRNAPGTAVINETNSTVLYTPPEGEQVIREKLHNLEEFIHTDDAVDPLIKMAVMHYQFEAIHPFSDGNGRTGRILNILYLVKEGLLDLPVLYHSKYIIENKSEYYRLLRLVTEKGSWEPWLLYMLDVVEQTASFTGDVIIKIRRLMEETAAFAKEHLPSRVYSKDLVELLFHQPYVKVQFLVKADIAERKTAAEYLKELEKIGILERQKVGKENLFLNRQLFKLLQSGQRET